jgi:hydroxymethylpyrimidine pyrophosphatase-like HAD family hydrolase
MSFQFLEKRPIIVFDLDGTLLNTEGGVHPNDAALLSMPNPPAEFIPATGRSLFALRKTFQAAGILNGKPIPYPMVLQNGALVFDRGEQKIHYKSFESDIQARLIEICKTRPETAFLLFGETDLIMLHPTPFGMDETERYMFTPRIYSDELPYLPMSKIMCLSDDTEVLREISALVEGYDIEKSLSTPTILEFNPSGITKGTGLETLMDIYDWDRDLVFCAGDGENDLGMFEKFPNSFAPVTCPLKIQNKAGATLDPRPEGLLRPMLRLAKQHLESLN